MIVTVLAMFTLSGCQLIVVNAERDMAQDIAVVEIDPALREVVKKKDLVSAYNSEGYYYVEYQGYDSEEVYTTFPFLVFCRTYLRFQLPCNTCRGVT